MHTHDFIFKVYLSLDFMLERNRILDSWWQTVILFVCVKLSLEYLLDPFDSVLQHSYKIFHYLLNWPLQMKRLDRHLELLVCGCRVNKNLLNIFYQFWKSVFIAYPCQHWEKFKLNFLAEPIYLDCGVYISVDDNLLLIAFGLRVNLVVQCW